MWWKKEEKYANNKKTYANMSSLLISHNISIATDLRVKYFLTIVKTMPHKNNKDNFAATGKQKSLTKNQGRLHFHQMNKNMQDLLTFFRHGDKAMF